MSSTATASTRPITPWSGYTVFIAFVAVYILLPFTVTQFMRMIWPAVTEDNLFVTVQASTIIGWALAFSWLTYRYQDPVGRYLGLSPLLSWQRLISYGTLAIIGSMGMVALLYFTTQWLGVEPENPYQDIPEHNLEILSWLALVSAPFIEELVFRGFLQTTLYRYFHPAVAIGVTALIFLLFHGAYSESPVAMINVLGLGLIYGLLRDRSGSTLPGMVGHLFNNAMAAAVLLNP